MNKILNIYYNNLLRFQLGMAGPGVGKWKWIFKNSWLQSQVQSPLWTSLLTLTICGWWYSALELHSSTAFILFAIFRLSLTILVNGSRNFFITTHLNFSGSPLCLASWCFFIKLLLLPELYRSLWFPLVESRVYIFLDVSPKYVAPQTSFRAGVSSFSFSLTFLWTLLHSHHGTPARCGCSP